MARLLHLGDLHLGRSLAEFDLIDDQRYILEQILQIIDAQNVDAVLIAGDVYDRAIPSEAATRLLDWFLSALSGRGVKTFLISGNHDSDDRLHFGSALFEASDIFISSVFDGTLCRRTLTDEYGEIGVYLLPFVKASQVRHFFPDEKIESYEDAVRVILSHTEIDPGQRNILVAHQFVAGKSKDPSLAGSENASIQSVGLVEKIGWDVFSEFDYVALGHIHTPQAIEKDTIRYAGSILKYSLSEAAGQKSVPLITFGKSKTPEMELLPLHPMRDLRHVKGPMERLLAKENIQSVQDFLYVTLTDEEIINDAMQIFRQVFPNTVKIEYDNSHTRQIVQTDIAAISKHHSFRELISDFYMQMYGCEISEEELAVIQEAAKEAHVINEAD